jgi:hypothetical protein
MAKINPQKIFKHRSYTIKELCEALNVHPRSCQRWFEEGLQIITGCKKPILMRGEDIKTFLNNRKIKRKIALKKNQFLCLACKDARFAKRGSIKVVGNKKTALCRACNGKMSRII